MMLLLLQVYYGLRGNSSDFGRVPTRSPVWSPFRRLLALAAAAVLAGTACGGNDRAARETGVIPSPPRPGAAIPLLAPWSPQSLDSDLPPAVRARMERELRPLLARTRAAARMPATAAAGCVPSGMGGTPDSLGPPAPEVRPRVFGHHVEVVFEYRSMPSSPACRPAVLDVVVYSGQNASASFNNAGAVGHFLLRGSRGRVVLDLPWNGGPPYRLVANSSSLAGRRGPSVGRSLRCPGTGDFVRGCLPGYRPALHSLPLPKPVLPVRGLDRSKLERSLRYVLAGGPRVPVARAVRCPSLDRCEITYVDPAFPSSPYRVRYRIAGEQIPGCWMGMIGSVEERPYEDAGVGSQEIASCASWVR
jgi:hypothetical protein